MGASPEACFSCMPSCCLGAKVKNKVQPAAGRRGAGQFIPDDEYMMDEQHRQGITTP